MTKNSIVGLVGIISVVFIIAVVAVSCKPLVESVYSEEKTITATDGSEFTVVFLEENVPDTEITITISKGGQRIAEDGSFDAYLSDYDYQNDFVDHWYQIVDEHHSDAVNAYLFNWGILYTVNAGDTYELIPKHTYETRKNNSKEVRAILEHFGI